MATTSSVVQRATQYLRQYTPSDVPSHQQDVVDADDADIEADHASYEEEIQRINHTVQAQRCQRPHLFLPALYLRGRNPAAESSLRTLRSASKSFELNLRFKEIEVLDEMQSKLWELLSVDGRPSLTISDYMSVMEQFNEWDQKRTSDAAAAAAATDAASLFAAPTKGGPSGATETATDNGVGGSDDRRTADDAARGGHAAGPYSVESRDASTPATAVSAQPSQLTTSGGGDGARRSVSPGSVSPCSVSPRSVSHGSHSGRHRHVLESTKEQIASLNRPSEEETPLGKVLYVSTVPTPRPTVELFVSCLNGSAGLSGGGGGGSTMGREEEVDVLALFRAFAKRVSLVKSEAELIMWDTDNDGRLSEDEIENYVRDLVPRLTALRDMPEDLMPFYCCTASRRLFWDLDPGNRGVVRIDALLLSPVMDEWLSLQLMTEDIPTNWFGASATQELYKKFLLLDTRGEGTLDAENLRHYKRGLPTVFDDGLPPDESPLCPLFVDRYFETNLMMSKSEMDYRKFVDFVIAVEQLPECSRPLFFWNILDLEGTGVLTPLTTNYFFRETRAKLVAAVGEAAVPSVETVVQEVFDLIATAEPLRITREEFVRSPQAGLFVALLVDCLSFWRYEHRQQR